jgi:predicted GNAT family N-acyltransferase
MASLQTPIPGLTLIKPNPSRHAPITLSWFTSENGRETLLLMGNAEHEIETPSLDSEQQTLQEFVDLEAKNEQLTWMIELTKNHNVLPPSVHLMIGDKTYRGRGVGKVVMQTLIQYINDTTDSPAIYSRHLKSNVVVTKMNQSLGFINDKQPYVDDNGLEWQNIKLLI